MAELWLFLKLYRRYAGILVLGVLLAMITLLASIGLLALSGWFITATSLAGLTLATAQIFNFFTPGAGVRGFSIVRIGSRYVERLVSHDATFRLLAWLREWFFSKLMPLSLLRVGHYRKGDLLNRLVVDVDALDQLYLRLVSPLMSAVMISVVLFGLMACFSVPLAVFFLVVMVFWIMLMPLLFYMLGCRVGESLGNAQKNLRQQLLDHLQGMAEGLIYGYNRKSRAVLSQTIAVMQNSQLAMIFLEGFGSFLLIGGAGSAAIAMLWLASGEFQQQHISGPVMVMMVFVVLAGFEALMALPKGFQYLSHTRQAATRLKEVIEEQPIVFPAQQQEVTIRGHIQFDSIRFGYHCNSSADQPVLNDLCLNISDGEHIAVVGKTGCGKSSLVRLLNRGVEPLAGRVLLDGRAVQSFTEMTLYDAMTFIPQRTHVFSATLRDNLLLAAPTADDKYLAEIIEAVGLMNIAGNAYKSVSKLLDVWIGEAGLLLSGGEQCRLAVARALLKPAPILVMDEPTEGLDHSSAHTLLTLVLNAFRESTVLMITHKKVMLENMDAVYRIQAGAIDKIAS